MSELIPGQICDDAVLGLYGKSTFTRYNVYASVIEDSSSMEPSLLTNIADGGYVGIESVFSHKLSLTCPSCQKTVDLYAIIIEEDSFKQVLFCPVCRIAFRKELVGYIDEDGDYHALHE